MPSAVCFLDLRAARSVQLVVVMFSFGFRRPPHPKDGRQGLAAMYSSARLILKAGWEVSWHFEFQPGAAFA